MQIGYNKYQQSALTLRLYKFKSNVADSWFPVKCIYFCRERIGSRASGIVVDNNIMLLCMFASKGHPTSPPYNHKARCNNKAPYAHGSSHRYGLSLSVALCSLHELMSGVRTKYYRILPMYKASAGLHFFSVIFPPFPGKVGAVHVV